MKYGLGGLNNKFNSNSNNNFNVNTFASLQQIITPVRVKNIILDDTNPEFKKYGEWNGLGVIEYVNADKPYNSPIEGYAFPLNPNNKQYPLINELVYLIDLPDTNIAVFTSSKKQYYINIISLWNHPHHNGFPANPYELSQPQTKDYRQTSIGGNVRKITDNSTEIFLGNTFKERANIHPLLPFEGDIILEGRWGNSIRFGSTVQNKPNNWSSTGINGDPITIIRNGQLIDASNEGWKPITEDINKDISSVYLSSTQTVPLIAASINYNSYSISPTKPDKYSESQIIINSGRLVLNSNKDHILLSSNKSINLNSVESINIDTKSTIVNSNSILLGGKDASESVLKGDTTIKLVLGLVDQLIALSVALQSIIPPSGPAVAPAATQLIPYLNKLKLDLETTTKSKISKTL
jgi:hypothetical protein